MNDVPRPRGGRRENLSARPGPPASRRTAERPFDPVHVLGCSAEQARTLFNGRPVTPGEAEAIAEQVYPWRTHLRNPDSYWITRIEAARILGITADEVGRLLDQRRLPHIRHASGVRLMRRRQIEEFARYRAPERA